MSNSQLTTNEELFCKVVGHNAKLIESICTDPRCDNPLSCHFCLVKSHKKCEYPNILFEDVLAKSFKKFDDWPHNETIRSYLQKSEEMLNSAIELENSIDNITKELKNEILKIVDTSMGKIKCAMLAKAQPALSCVQKMQQRYDLEGLAKHVENFKNGQQSQETFRNHIRTKFKCIEDEEKYFLNKLTNITASGIIEDEKLAHFLVSLKTGISNMFQQMPLDVQLVHESSTGSDVITETDTNIYKTIEIKNTGIIDWPTNSIMESIRDRIKGENVVLQALAPNKSIDVVLVIKSPCKTGKYTMPWRLCYNDEKGDSRVIGEPFNVTFEIQPSKQKAQPVEEVKENKKPKPDPELEKKVEGKKPEPVDYSKLYTKQVIEKAKALQDWFPDNTIEFYLEYVNRANDKSIDELIGDYLFPNRH